MDVNIQKKSFDVSPFPDPTKMLQHAVEVQTEIGCKTFGTRTKAATETKSKRRRLLGKHLHNCNFSKGRKRSGR